MSITTTNQAIISFKHVFGKSQTTSTKTVNNESEGITFNISGDSVWTSTIDSTPATAVTAGVAVQVTANMILDGTSNGHALFAVWPTSPPSGTDPITSSAFAYGTGSLTGITAGNRVHNAIPSAFGAGYFVAPYFGANLIPPLDARNWVYQYNSGIFFQESGTVESFNGSLYGDPSTIQLYVYIGRTVTDVVSSDLWELTSTDLVTGSTLGTPNILPYNNDAQDIGSPSQRWRDIYLASDINFDTTINFILGGVSPDDNIAKFDVDGLTMSTNKVIKSTDGENLYLEALSGGTVNISSSGVNISSGGGDIEIFTQTVGMLMSYSMERILLITGISMFVPTYSAIITSATDEIASIENATSSATGASFRARNYKFYNDNSPTAPASIPVITSPTGTDIRVTATTQEFSGISAGYTGSQERKQQSGVQTTNATITTIATIATDSNELIVIKGTVAGFDGGVGSPAFATAYGSTFFAVFRNTGGTLTQVSTTDLSEKYDFSGTPTTTISSSGSNILIRVTGVAATTINWITTYEYTKLQTNS